MLLAVPLLGLTACGETMGDRAVSGAGLGAGVGLLGGALVGAPLAGALVGGALGAGAGMVTTPNQVDLGRPAWR
jgi:osmotically inducible lipoprotein OsmB